MPSPFAAAALLGFLSMRSAAGVPVTYRRGGSASVDVSAIPLKPEVESDEREGMVTRLQGRDFLILAADLVLSDAATEPTVGDRIISPEGTFEVSRVGGVRHWRYCDQYQVIFRVHTRQVLQS